MSRYEPGCNLRYRARPPPFVGRRLPVSSYLAGVAEELEASGILFDAVDGGVVERGFAIGREDIREEEICDAALMEVRSQHLFRDGVL